MLRRLFLPALHADRLDIAVEGLDLAIYARDSQLMALARVRELGDQLEKVVADDLWPLPKYSEILFIK